MQVSRIGPHWAIRNYDVIIAIAGAALFFSAGPVTSSLQGTEEEIAIASEYYEKGLDYKGRDFLDWRDGPMWVWATMWYAGVALVFSAVIIAGLKKG